MRYTVQFQSTTGHWVVYDKESYTMLGSYRSEKEASAAALRIEEYVRQRRLNSGAALVA